jgi:hypothetical protein
VRQLAPDPKFTPRMTGEPESDRLLPPLGEIVVYALLAIMGVPIVWVMVRWALWQLSQAGVR